MKAYLWALLITAILYNIYKLAELIIQWIEEKIHEERG